MTPSVLRIDNEVIKAAFAFSVAAHEAVGQKRKYSGEEYWRHPLHVAQILYENVTNVPYDVLAAAFLHDVVEDTQVGNETIEIIFNPTIAKLVEEVTDVSKPEDGNRATRKALDRDHLKEASFWGKTIKLADLISNTESIVEHDKDFAAVYMKEKKALLEILEGGHVGLLAQARKINDDYFKTLDND